MFIICTLVLFTYKNHTHPRARHTDVHICPNACLLSLSKILMDEDDNDDKNNVIIVKLLGR